jgi:hypothetical protein
LLKKLKELGFEQESLFKYWDGDLVCEIKRGVLLDEDGFASQIFRREELLSAYTVAELGEMLPEKVKTPYGNKSFSIFREVCNETWDVAYSTDTDDDENLWQQAETEADSRAKMLIYLKENNLI